MTALLRRRVDALLVVPDRLGPPLHPRGRLRHEDRVRRPPPAQDPGRHRAGRERRRAPGAASRTCSTEGHKRIAFVGDDLRLYTARERLTGYRRALETAGLEPSRTLVSVGHSTSDARRAGDAGAAGAAPRDGDRPRSSPATTAARSARCTPSTADRQRLALVGFDDFELADLLGRHRGAHRPLPRSGSWPPSWLRADRRRRAASLGALVVPAELVDARVGRDPA